MASSRSEENVNLNYYNNWWCHSYGDTCTFFEHIVKLNWQMLLPVIVDCMADVIANYV